MKLPPSPKWNTKTDDIDWADSLRRSQDDERSILPVDTVFPRAGQIWAAVADCEVHMHRWLNPKYPSLGPDAPLARGERVYILELDHPKPLEVRFLPVRYEELHEILAPDSLRYELWLTTVRSIWHPLISKLSYFNELFRMEH